MAKLFRTNLGPLFSEGARRLWLAMRERGWSRPRLEDELDTGGGTLPKILYGDRGVGRKLANKIHEKLGIAQAAWDQKPLEEFIPPAGEEEPAAASDVLPAAPV